MPRYKVQFSPIYKAVTVEAGTTLLEAAGKAHIAIDSVCGGDGICGRCKMIVREGAVRGDVSPLLTREEIRQGVVLACQTTVQSDVVVDIPEETRARDKIVIDRDAQRFRAERAVVREREFERSPLVTKVCLRLDPPTLENNLADCQRLQMVIEKETGISSMQTGLKIIRRVPEILRQNDFTITATIGMRRGIAEVMDLEGGDTSAENYMAIVDAGTSTIVVHLVDAVTMATVDAQACFNSQATYGREVTTRMISAEKRGAEQLQQLLVGDINELIRALATKNSVNLKDINAVVCAGNTAMMHFLLGLPTENIRRDPFIAVTVEPPPFRAAEVGIKINPRGLLFAMPGIGGWIGGDITAGILATGLYDMDGVGMMIDVGTNGEIIVGNKDWLMACSASAGPALEGAGVECGMMAQQGAIEKVWLEDGE
ncbi:MAG: ASKHA domain-containing protein, partial [Planctomycetota bacterium]